jgi:hypothetical protein
MLNGLIKPDAGSITMRGRVGAHFCSTLGSGRSTPLPSNGPVLGLTKKEPERRPPAGRVLRLGERYSSERRNANQIDAKIIDFAEDSFKLADAESPLQAK